MAPERDHVLAVDLSTGSVDREPIPDGWRDRYLGGKGLGARYLYDRLEPGVDPLDASNVLAFMLGPLSGYLPGETRYVLVTKSPLTGAFLDSYSGGSFPAALSGALDDAMGVLVTGRADEPVRLVIEEGAGRLEPAETWGADTVETASAVEGSVACIGPAGERGVSYATVASDGGEHHAGRGGGGAVMGDKRLKAVVARGDPPAPDGALRELRERYERDYAEHETGRWQAAGGTVETVDFAHEIGALATRGWQRGQFEDVGEIGIEAATTAAAGREQAGDLPGDFRFDAETGEVVVRGAAPMTLGAGLGIDDVEDVAMLAERCDRLGLDVIDAGNAVAWAIRADDAGAVECPVEFGDAAAARRLVEAIATGRELEEDGYTPGLVDALGEGVDAASERFGAAELIPTVKSMSLPAYDPRGSLGMALAYATSDRGGCHRRARPIELDGAGTGDGSLADRVRTVVGEQTVRSVLWSLVSDDFVGETMWADLGREWLAAVGHHKSEADLVRVGERIWTLIRLFNAREGFDREADRLPAPMRESLPDGPAAGESIDAAEFDRALDAYYRARGWGPNGLPTRETVAELGLADALDGATPLDEPW